MLSFIFVAKNYYIDCIAIVSACTICALGIFGLVSSVCSGKKGKCINPILWLIALFFYFIFSFLDNQQASKICSNPNFLARQMLGVLPSTIWT